MFTFTQKIRQAALMLALALAFPLPTFAQPVTLSDTPALDVNLVKPNIMFTLDTSGSMAWNYVPDQALLSGATSRSNWDATRNCFRNYIANPMYYNPAETYNPPKHYDAATNTVTSLPDVPFLAAPENGYAAGGITVNLSTQFRANWEYGGNASGVGTFSTFSSGPTTAGAATYAVYTPAGTPTPGLCYPNASYNLVTVPAAQQQNFANWFSYYRSRMQAMKAAAGLAFSNLDDSVRVGFHNIWNTGGSFLGIGDFSGNQRQTWYNRFYASVPANGTPLRNATYRIGEYFRTGTMPGMTAAASGPDPILYSCQGNYHILSTDGYWNDGSEPALPGTKDFDNTVPTLPSTVTGLTSGSAWPRLFRQSTSTPATGQINTNTLSDIATYYWATDLRPSMVNNVPRENSGSFTADPANWQHVVMFGVSIAAQGVLPYDVPKKAPVPPAPTPPATTLTPAQIATWMATLSETERTLYRIQTGAAWPTTGVASDGTPWPTGVNAGPGGTAVWPNPDEGTGSTIDDLWHATVNSRGNFFNVNTAKDLANSLYDALNDISARGGTAAGAALADAVISASVDNVVYVPSYISGKWTGDLLAKVLNPTTGRVNQIPDPSNPGSFMDDVKWNHAQKLDAMVSNAGANNGWDVNRKILTWSGADAVPFRLASLNTVQAATLGATAAEQQAVLNYLRGSLVDEDQIAPTSRKFRVRESVLGDIVASEPRAVKAPIEKYTDGYNPGYSAFRTAQANRTPMVYFGANDGFIHAVNGEITGANAGKEMFAYLPSQLLRAGNTGIKALTFKPVDPLPNRFTHHFYVDGQGFHRDVDFSRTSQNAATPTPTSGAAPDWRTVFITGLGKGGTSYVALDITNPAEQTESQLVTNKKVLWEFTDPDMGYTYGTPIITKTARYGWVALLASGYNNTTGTNAGKGIVFVVDIKSGALLHKFITADGSAANPINMGYINVFVPDVTDFTATDIYGSDLQGNIWRFDISSAAPYVTSGVKFAELRNASNQIQPITTYVVPHSDPISGKRFVAVGTGKLFSPADLTDLSQQTLYNIQDGDVYTPKATGLPVRRADLNAIARTDDQKDLPSSSKGWYSDLIGNPGERIVKPVLAQLGVVVGISIAPSTNACDKGGIGTAYARGAATGNNLFTGGTTWMNPPNNEPIVGARLVSVNGKPVVQIVSSTGKINTIDNLTVPGGFKGTVVNYREFIE